MGRKPHVSRFGKYSDVDFVKDLIKNNYFLIGVTFVLSYLMHAELHLFSLKFKDYSWKNNKVKFVFLILTIALVIGLQFIAIPLVILVYILFSIFFKEL